MSRSPIWLFALVLVVGCESDGLSPIERALLGDGAGAVDAGEGGGEQMPGDRPDADGPGGAADHADSGGGNAGGGEGGPDAAGSPVTDAAVLEPDAAVEASPDAAPDAEVLEPDPDAAVVQPEPDAAVVQPEPDAAVVQPEPDAAVVQPEPDAAVVQPEPDAAVIQPEPDAAVIQPEPDAEVIEPDAEVIEPDAEVIEPDAEVIEPDAEVIEPDAEVIEPDAEVIEPDAEVIEPDAELLPLDAALPEPDAEVAEAPAYLYMDDDTILRLRAIVRNDVTQDRQIQVVGDSISETYLMLNPITFDPAYPEMGYADPIHTRVFGQHAIFFDVTQTAASSQTASWGLNGAGDWGGLANLVLPSNFQDKDPARAPIGVAVSYPEIATIMFGTNDIRRWFNDQHVWFGPNQQPGIEWLQRNGYVSDMRLIAQWLLDRGIVPLFLTFPPGTYGAYAYTPMGEVWGDREGRQMGEVWNTAIIELGEEMQVPVLDIHQAFLDSADWQALIPDGVHPNAAGYSQVINPLFYDAYRNIRQRVIRR